MWPLHAVSVEITANNAVIFTSLIIMAFPGVNNNDNEVVIIDANI